MIEARGRIECLYVMTRITADATAPLIELASMGIDMALLAVRLALREHDGWTYDQRAGRTMPGFLS